jgi:FKBP-type peptidyl-prolyl cis-trans isomerase FklB
MNKTLGIAAILAASVVSTSALAMDKLSYTLGYKASQALKVHVSTLNTKDYMTGLKDAFAGKPSQLTEKQMQAAILAFQASLVEKAKDRMSKQAEINLKASEAFMQKNKQRPGVKVLEPGLQYRVITAGGGAKPAVTDRVRVTYEGRLINNKVFDKSQAPVTFGLNQVIPGWTKALSQMPEGSTWEIYIDPKLAYGEQAPPMIGPNQALIFKVHLLKIEK